MDKPKFVYVTYIRTTPEKLWSALTDPKFTRQYFFGSHQECAWKPSAPWKMVFPDGTVAASGEVLVIDPPRKLVLSWKSEKNGMTEEEPARMTYLIEEAGEQVKFTVLHESNVAGSKIIESVSGGWPVIIASLKSFLETGKPLDISFQGTCDGNATEKAAAARTN